MYMSLNNMEIPWLLFLEMNSKSSAATGRFLTSVQVIDPKPLYKILIYDKTFVDIDNSFHTSIEDIYVNPTVLVL